MDDSPEARLARALDSLEGLSVGDAFGEGFFLNAAMAERLMATDEFDLLPGLVEDHFLRRELVDVRRLDFHKKPWKWTDDTALALEIVAQLRDAKKIEPDELARAFSRRYQSDPRRGYGGAMHSLLPVLRFGEWEKYPPSLFGGTGSFGNGAAMRAAPLGAYFADDPQLCAREAALSSRVTHSHLEGVAGGVATAMAACFAARARQSEQEIDLIAQVLPFVPQSEVKVRLEQAQRMENATGEQVADSLGAGNNVSAQDTVPFCLWCAGQSLEFYEEALWETVSGLGDRDTTCAIVGGIVAARVGSEGIPQEWRENREELGEF
ncbi:ADP-ribosylglycohydrolase [Abditibacterium utsteinense]|uniref:ADP-ribosylglycohydrolase n=1 Tax=Abditibacterium utsteinense TaxID=1960156 RepID=A0A2S8SX21_9BACT|nr:ADP-ribosylglycohydrolase family protein [Abditibacterium utsteinense]PQV65347.1 ADP-ribosylglycohydrolase [Abditibacterium utsteinense]